MKIKWIGIPLSLLTVMLLWPGCKSNTGKTGDNSGVINVETTAVAYANGGIGIGFSGTIEESESIPLCFPGVGTVTKVYVNEGDPVKKGQLLAELNNESYKNMYEMSSASLKQAEDAYKRLLPMYKNGNLPEIKLIEVETSVQQARSSALIAKKNLDDCRLFAPTDGILGKRSIDPGMTAMPNLASLTIVRINKVYAIISVSENEISTIKKSEPAEIVIPALSGRSFSGKIEEIGVIANPITRTYKIKISAVNSGSEIRPGMICNVRLTGTSSKALVVPAGAVSVDEKGRNFLYIVTSGSSRAQRKYVTTGRLMQNNIEITSGLAEGDLVVTAGRQKLFDNALVNISQN